MSSHIEMLNLAQTPGAAGSLASYLLNINGVDWTDWETDFLESLAARQDLNPISTRQREKLFELRDDAKNYSKFDGFSVSGLVKKCWQARLDLSDEDEEFILNLYEMRTTTLKRRPVLRLLNCARKLDLIDGYIDID